MVVESEPSVGSRFTRKLPVVSDLSARAAFPIVLNGDPLEHPCCTDEYLTPFSRFLNDSPRSLLVGLKAKPTRTR